MLDLTKPISNRIIVCGKSYGLNLSYDRVLSFFELLSDDALSDIDKLEVAFEWFVPNGKKLSLEDKILAVNTIIDEHIKRKDSAKSDEPPLFDFSQDSEYIYASFLAEYGIDLLDVRGKLSWERFIALFNGLTDDTKIKEVMSIRARPIPKPTKYNREEIAALQKMKLAYALKSTAATEQAAQSQWNKLFDIMMKKAGEQNG